MIDTGASLAAVACRALTQCTGVDGSGREVTFNPASPAGPKAVTIDPGFGLSDVVCPLATQCTAVDPQGAPGHVRSYAR
jgi:hypothetical protein